MCECVVLYRKLKFSRLIVAVFVVGRVVNVGGNDFIIIMHILGLNGLRAQSGAQTHVVYLVV